MKGAPRSALPGPGILVGVARLARGRADGLALFPSDVTGFTASLAPFIALPLVGAVLVLLQAPGFGPLADLLSTWCALLAPPVLSWELARRWGREALWLRYATAFNWCTWAVPVFALILLPLLGFAVMLGMPVAFAGVALPLGLAAYALWLHWFLARHGLQLGGGRAALLVVAVNAGAAVLAFGPAMLRLL